MAIRILAVFYKRGQSLRIRPAIRASRHASKRKSSYPRLEAPNMMEIRDRIESGWRVRSRA
jgi:hypothetical protein